MLFLFFLLPMFLPPAPALAQQDCVTGIHQFQGGQCTVTFVNTCGKPLNCTGYVEGISAAGQKVSDSKPMTLPSGGSVALSVAGVARCGTFDLQCNQSSTPRRR